VRLLSVALALFVAGCATVYERPTDDDPHAIIEYRRVYDPQDPQSMRESLQERLMIEDHVAYEATIHAAVAQGPRVDEVRVRAEPSTFTASVRFFHLAQRGLGAVPVTDDSCSRAVQFRPADGRTYVLELSFRDDVCSLSCVEQASGPGGGPQNRACPAAPTAGRP
jgi:hypothetical protein